MPIHLEAAPRPRPLLGISLQADRQFLALNRALIEERAEVFEVAPETLWTTGAEPSPAWHVFRRLRETSGRPMVAHGLAFSLGAATPPAHRAAWVAAMRRDREAMGYLWWSDHLGFTDAAGIHTGLPLPLPRTAETLAACGDAFRAMQDAVPTVAFENAAGYFALGDPLDTPRLWADLCAAPPHPHLLLDLHNVHVECTNFGIQPAAYLEAVPWDRVLEIHLSGGSESDPSLLASGRSFRLDSHNGAVPEAVWQLFDAVLPRCSALRAVIVEWIPDGMSEADAAAFARDFERARRALC